MEVWKKKGVHKTLIPNIYLNNRCMLSLLSCKMGHNNIWFVDFFSVHV